MPPSRLLLPILAAACLHAEIAVGDRITARVEHVHDGDSLRATIAGVDRDLRLWGVDAPEHGQPGADASRDALAARVTGREVVALVMAIDVHGRLVVRLGVNRTEVNLAQLGDGHAWWFRRFAGGNDAYRLAEAAARAGRKGLWSAADPEAPWDYRDRLAE